MKPFNHIAVMLRGHMRTWHYISNEVFNFYHSISDNVDYYLATWDIPNIDKEKIRSSFQGQNLISLKFVNPSPRFYVGTAMSCAWLSKNITLDKAQREQQVSYNAVFETRPDVFYRIIPDTVVEVKENSFYSIRPKLETINTGEQKWFLEDYFFVMSNSVFNIMTERYISHRIYPDNTQIEISMYAESKGVEIAKINWAEVELIRPSILEEAVDLTTFFDPSLNNAEKNTYLWQTYTDKKKIQVCEKFGINLEDYRCSGSHRIKIN